ncbi:hypothetical protein F5H01DRAFT_374600 [Linnemannia elongata]|nr:hypothetical protein F5H01DRAFT_374600 [Linnemannia elongata]
MHPNVTMIWRPVSGGRFLEYMVEYVMEALGAISWTQLTVLGIVSYNNNINGLGCATNFSIIKSLSGTDVPGMVAGYLADSRVVIKNKDKLDFDASIRVFTFGQQTPIPRQESNPSGLTADKIKAKFHDVQQRYEQRKGDDVDVRKAAKSALPGDRVYRHKASQQFNRYRIIDHPPPKDKKPPVNGNPMDHG